MCENFDHFDVLDWQDWMIIGPLSEQIGEEMREQDRVQKEMEDGSDDDYGALSIDDDE